MTFRYGYNTPDNRRQFDTIAAASRDAAYAELKKKGIRPFSVELAPGLLNKLASMGKRGLAIAILVIALLASVGAIFAMREGKWHPSEAYLALEKDAKAVLEINDYEKARMGLRTVFVQQFNGLSEDLREREAAKALYGELSLEIDRREADQQEASRITK